MCTYLVSNIPKKIEQNFSYNYGCLAVIIRFLTHPMLCDCDIAEKCLLLLCVSKWLCIETIEWKFLHFFMWDTKWARSPILSGCRAHPSTRSRSAWTMGKVLTDVQAVVERLVDRDSLRDAIWNNKQDAFFVS